MIELVLDQCIEEIRMRRATVADCLAKYPQYADELEPLLETAAAIARAPEVRPAPGFKLKTRAQLTRALRPAPATRASIFQPRFSFAMAAALLLLVIGLGVTTVSAANASLPDSPLYSIKRGVEQVQLWLTFDPGDQARAHMDFAERRLAETKALSRNSAADALLIQSIEDYNAQVEAAAAAAPSSSQPSALNSELTNKLDRHKVDLKGLEKKVPEKALEKALDTTEKAKDLLKKN